MDLDRAKSQSVFDYPKIQPEPPSAKLPSKSSESALLVSGSSIDSAEIASDQVEGWVGEGGSEGLKQSGNQISIGIDSLRKPSIGESAKNADFSTVGAGLMKADLNEALPLLKEAIATLKLLKQEQPLLGGAKVGNAQYKADPQQGQNTLLESLALLLELGFVVDASLGEVGFVSGPGFTTVSCTASGLVFFNAAMVAHWPNASSFGHMSFEKKQEMLNTIIDENGPKTDAELAEYLAFLGGGPAFILKLKQLSEDANFHKNKFLFWLNQIFDAFEATMEATLGLSDLDQDSETAISEASILARKRLDL